MPSDVTFHMLVPAVSSPSSSNPIPYQNSQTVRCEDNTSPCMFFDVATEADLAYKGSLCRSRYVGVLLKAREQALYS